MQSLRAALVCLACATSTWQCLGEEAAQPASAATPEQLINTLEKGNFDQRQDAVKQLELLGEKARPALEKAARESEVYEVRATAERLLSVLSKASLRIQVIDTRGQPLAGVELQAHVWRPAPLHGTLFYLGSQNDSPLPLKTGPDGTAVLGAIAPCSLVHCAVESGLAQQGEYTLWFMRSGANKLLLIPPRGGTLAGTILAAGDGKPLVDANVFLVPDVGQDVTNLDPQKTYLQHTDNKAAAMSNAQGRFTIEHAAEGSYLLFAEHKDCATLCYGTVRLNEDSRTELPAPLRLASRAAVYGALKVQLLDEQGQPLKDTNVAVHTMRWPVFLQAPAAQPDADALQAWFRYVLNTSGQASAAQQVATDSAGYLELKDLWPGAYRVSVLTRRERDTQAKMYQLSNAAVAAGQTTDAGSHKPLECGSVSGRVIDPKGLFHGYFISPNGMRQGAVWALAEDDPLSRLVLSDLTRYESWFGSWQGQRFGEEQELDCATRFQNDKFVFRHLAPGKYTLVITAGNGTMGVIHGVEVAAGKEVQLPAFRLAGHDRPANQGRMEGAISGRVLLPDGKPAQGAHVSLWNSQEFGPSYTKACSEKGTFSFEPNEEYGEPSRLSASMPGYLTCHVDLPADGTPLKGITLQLEESRHGSLEVTVCGPAGSPLPGALAAVLPPGDPGYRWATCQVAPADKAGRVLLQGLACGPRRIDVVKDGYYLPEPVQAVVLPDKTTPVRVTMQAGVRLAGRLETPAGMEKTEGMVCLEYHQAATTPYYDGWRRCFSAPVDSAGHFEFSGLWPGKVSLNLLCPGLVLAQDKTETELSPGPAARGVGSDATATSEVVLKAVYAGALRIDFGPENRGVRFWLVAPGSWDPARGIEHLWPDRVGARQNTAQGNADSLGQAMLRDVRPGTYDLLVGPPCEEDLFKYTQHGVAAWVCPGITVPALPGRQAVFDKLEPLRLRPIRGGSEVRGRLILKDVDKWQAGESDVGRLRVTIANKQIVGSIDFYLPDDLDPKLEPPEAGKPSSGFRMVPPEFFRIAGVPPGEYSLYLEYEIPEHRRQPRGERQRFDAAPRPAKTIRVTAAKVVEVEDITVEVPPEIIQQMRAAPREDNDVPYRWRDDNELGQDLAPGFQP